MIQVIFKNLEKSKLTRDSTLERINPLVSKFPGLQQQRIRITLEMHNSPEQAGPDLFSVSLQVLSGRYRGLRLEKSGSHLYEALSELVDDGLERLNRFGDRARTKQRIRSRRWMQNFVKYYSFS